MTSGTAGGAALRNRAGDEAAITAELIDTQGTAMDIGGYYQPDPALAVKAMRPSEPLNGLVEGALAQAV